MIHEYQVEAKKRTELNIDKTGLKTEELMISNLILQNKIPIYISDYVIMSYGTGSIIAISEHNQRDYNFANEFNLEIIKVISGGNISIEAYSGEGLLVNYRF